MESRSQFTPESQRPKLTTAKIKSLSAQAVAPIEKRLADFERNGVKRGPRGDKGDDGLGFDDLKARMIGERTLEVTFSDGERSKSFEFQIPAVIYRGAYKAGEAYARGDLVSYGGSLWHANELTTDKPGSLKSKAFTLCVRRGRDGKDGENGKDGARGIKGPRGKDATQISYNGDKI